MSKPRIAILLDENTTRGGNLYEVPKNFFRAMEALGAIPYGIPFLPSMVEEVASNFDGLIDVGGFVAKPDAWYAKGHENLFPPSERVETEQVILGAFLKTQKPLLGICHTMQLLAVLCGAKIQSHLGGTMHKGTAHPITITEGSLLHRIVGQTEMQVNSRHSETITDIPAAIRVSATAPDGVIEAVEVEGHPFALGVQWHPEDFWGTAHPGNRIFEAFVKAC